MTPNRTFRHPRLLGGNGVLTTPSMIAFMERASIQAYFARRAHYRRLRGARQAFRSHPKRQVTVRVELIEVDAGKPRFKAHDEQEGWRRHPSARNHYHSEPGLIRFNHDHQLRNAAWDCRARAHHRRRDGHDRRCWDSTTTIDRLRSAAISNRRNAPFEVPTEIWKLTQEERRNDRQPLARQRPRDAPQSHGRGLRRQAGSAALYRSDHGEICGADAGDGVRHAVDEARARPQDQDTNLRRLRHRNRADPRAETAYPLCAQPRLGRGRTRRGDFAPARLRRRGPGGRGAASREGDLCRDARRESGDVIATSLQSYAASGGTANLYFWQPASSLMPTRGPRWMPPAAIYEYASS